MLINICEKFRFSALIGRKVRLKSIEVYGDTAPTDKPCRKWFRRFKDGDFSVEDKPHSRQPKKFEDKELEALLEEDQSQTQEELAELLRVTQQAVSVGLRTMGMIQKQRNWVPYELKRETLKGEQLFHLRTADSKTTEKRFFASDCD